MKCIGALHGFFIWVILCLAIWMFIPDQVSFVKDNAWWVIGLALTSWWFAGNIYSCNK